MFLVLVARGAGVFGDVVPVVSARSVEIITPNNRLCIFWCSGRRKRAQRQGLA